MSENLRAWLAGAGTQTGLIVPVGRKCLYKRLVSIRAKAGIDHWAGDVMRHSFATYHLALHRNAPATALEMGHSGVQMLYSNYRGLATGEAAGEYFGIRPG
jgi:integrase